MGILAICSYDRATGFESPSAMMKSNNCGSRTAGEVLFFARAKKSTQKKHAPERTTPSSVPRPTGRSPTRRPQTTRLDSNRGSLNCSRRGCGTRRALRGVKTPLVRDSQVTGEMGFKAPVWRARASQPASGYSRAPCLSPSRVVCGWRVGARAEAGEKRRRFSRHPGCVSFGYFSLHKQRKVTCRGSATHKYASPQATQN